MQLSNKPDKLVLPFAASGAKNTIPAASQIGIVAGKASLTDGFPPLTRTPLSAGGVPPSGLDMNGVLYEMSAVIRWANAGGGYPFDAAFAADANVGGYPKGARVLRSDGLGYWFNTADNQTVDPEDAGAPAAGWVPDFTSGATAVTMTGSNVTLTPLQYGKPIIVISGILSANLNLIFPAIVGQWTVVNNCTGNFAVTCKTATGSGIAFAIGQIRQIYGDGTNIGVTENFVAEGAGAVPSDIPKKLRLEICVDDFGAVGDGVTNDSAAVNLAATFMKTKIQSFGGYYGCSYYLKFSPGKVYKLANSINLQLIGHGAGAIGGWGVIGTGAVILAACTGKTLFDSLGSAYGEFIDITIRADSATAPAIGIQVGRIDTTGWSAGGHFFSNIHMVGFFSIAGLLNASGEGNTYLHVSIHNDDMSGNAYSLAIDGLHNIVPVTDFTQTTIAQNTFDSCRQHMIINCDLGQNHGSPLFLSNVSQLHVDGYIYASGTHAINFLAGGGQTTFRNLEFMAHCEAAITSQIEVRALSAQAVIFEGMTFREDASSATVAMITGSHNVTSLTLKDTDVFLGSIMPVPFLSGTAAFGAGVHVFKSSGGTSQLRTPQIVFPSTQVASTNANTLDDYKESSPALTVTSGTGTLTTVGATSCSLTKVGRLVTITFDITITTNGTGATQINITGAFPAATSGAYGTGRRLDTGNTIQMRVDSGTQTIVVVNPDNSYPGANGAHLAGTITYMAS